MTKDEIEDIIKLILVADGPDGHVDGYDVIARFVIAVQDGRGEAWARSYEARGRE